MQQSAAYAVVSRGPRPTPMPQRRFAEVLATEIVPALANAAADGEMAVRRALDRTEGQRAAMADFTRSRPLLTMAMASAFGWLLAARLKRATRPRRRTRLR